MSRFTEQHGLNTLSFLQEYDKLKKIKPEGE